MTVYLNGSFLPADRATVGVFDRGFLMGDGVYEGVRAFSGVPVWTDRHVQRMKHGLQAAGIEMDTSHLVEVSRELLRSNGCGDAFLYWQITRGQPGPDQPVRSRIPTGAMQPTVFAYASPTHPIEHYRKNVPTVKAAVVEDCRWLRGRLKSVSLLGNVLAALDANEIGAEEAIMLRDGFVAEACACNVILALPTSDGRTELVTPSLDSAPILAGITRERVCELDPSIVQRAVRADELSNATEVILTGTNATVTAVTHLDGTSVGKGVAGPHARRLVDLYFDAIETEVAQHEPAVSLESSVEIKHAVSTSGTGC